MIDLCKALARRLVVSAAHVTVAQMRPDPSAAALAALPGESWERRRAAVGLLFLAAAHAYWIGIPELSVGAVASSALGGLATNVATTFAAVVPAALILLVVGRRRWRPLMAEIRAPGRAVLTLMAAPACLLVWERVLLPPLTASTLGQGDPTLMDVAIGLMVALGTVALLLVLLTSMSVALYCAWRHRLRIPEGPRALLPLTVCLSGLATLIVGVAQIADSGWRPEYPLVAGLLLAVAGPASVTVLAASDLRHLVRTGGMTQPRPGSLRA